MWLNQLSTGRDQTETIKLLIVNFTFWKDSNININMEHPLEGFELASQLCTYNVNILKYY